METNCLQYNASNDTVCEYMYIVILVYYMYRYTWKHFFFKKHFCNDIITCWTNSIFWSSGCTNIDKFVTSFVKINGVSYSLPFFFATVFRNPVFTSWYVSLSPLFTLHVRVSFTSFRVFFFCRILYRDDRIKGTSSTRVQRNVGLDERFDREWRNLAAWLVHGDFWKNCRAPLPPFSVTQRWLNPA